jgi:hypothetical protein
MFSLFNRRTVSRVLGIGRLERFNRKSVAAIFSRLSYAKLRGLHDSADCGQQLITINYYRLEVTGRRGV